jgi:hypothetical protein
MVGDNAAIMAQRTAAGISFDAPLEMLSRATIVRLPQPASASLPSRGQVAVQGTLNGTSFRTVVEPDGDFGHWIKLDARLRRSAKVQQGDVASFAIVPLAEWPEPQVPADLAAALDAAPQRIRDTWDDITPMARWEWVRWVNATRNPETRQRRVEVSISKMDHGKRRPCCFNLASCTDPELSRSGKLLGLR